MALEGLVDGKCSASSDAPKETAEMATHRQQLNHDTFPNESIQTDKIDRSNAETEGNTCRRLTIKHHTTR